MSLGPKVSRVNHWRLSETYKNAVRIGVDCRRCYVSRDGSRGAGDLTNAAFGQANGPLYTSVRIGRPESVSIGHSSDFLIGGKQQWIPLFQLTDAIT